MEAGNSSLAGSNSNQYTVPVVTKRSKEGSIDYKATKASLDSTDGFFSFSFYLRDSIFGEKTTKGVDLYLNGLNYYRQILDKEPFLNWKILIYTDEFTYNELTSLNSNTSTNNNSPLFQLKDVIKKLLSDSRVIFAIVKWKKHQRKNTNKYPKVNGPVLRTFRSRAPFDFPTKYIFIRDADTFDEKGLQALSFGGRFKNKKTQEYSPELHQIAKDEFANFLYEWEKKFYELIPSIQESLGGKPAIILGTGKTGPLSQTYYKQPWHSNELLNKDAPYGVFAGLVSVTPGVPVYQNYDVWDELIDYIDERSVRNENHPRTMLERNYRGLEGLPPSAKIQPANLQAFRQNSLNRYTDKTFGENYLKSREEDIYYDFSNNEKPQKVGRDEQFYLFILMPKAMENIYIYHIELGDIYTAPKRNNAYHQARIDNLKLAIVKNFKRAVTGGKRKTQRIKFEKRKTRKSRY